jgi:hypothetical protein
VQDILLVQVGHSQGDVLDDADQLRLTQLLLFDMQVVEETAS